MNLFEMTVHGRGMKSLDRGDDQSTWQVTLPRRGAAAFMIATALRRLPADRESERNTLARFK